MYSHSHYPSDPPLPHQAQAHFYGAPSNYSGSPPVRSGIPTTEKEYFRGFDDMVIYSRSINHHPEPVLLLGTDGGVRVYHVGRDGFDKLSSIDNICGGVYAAKILPWTCGASTGSLIALVVHGPIHAQGPMSNKSFGHDQHSDVQQMAQGARNVRGTAGDDSADGANVSPDVRHQTSVVVYSLNTKRHIATLLTIPPNSPSRSPVSQCHAPSGALSIRADNYHIVVTSGTTGEIFIFRCSASSSSVDAVPSFSCLGKLWTATRSSTKDTLSLDNVADELDFGLEKPVTNRGSKCGLVSLQGRWLAYSPATTNTQHTLRAVIPDTPNPNKVPGLTTHAAPQQPQVNCVTDTPDGASILNRVAKEVTQEVIKGAKWVSGQGYQAWSHYWNKPGGLQQGTGGAHNPQLRHSPYQQYGQQFPPTHSVVNTQAQQIEPTLISILDIESLSTTTSGACPVPDVTFKAPQGCSFLSFAPSGLALFTASSKGDVQYIWDLMRMHHTKATLLSGTQEVLPGPRVRQIARFDRMTVARIVDVIWTMPHGLRAAMVTERGTIHVLDLPGGAYDWPPPRRRSHVSSAGSPSTADDNTSSQATSQEKLTSVAGIANVFSSALNIVNTTTKPLITAASQQRRKSGSAFTGISASNVTSHAGHGGKVIVAGLSKSFGAATGTVNHLRRSAENRVRLPHDFRLPSTGCAKWLHGKSACRLATLGGATTRIYTLKTRFSRSTGKGKDPLSVKYVDQDLPMLPQTPIIPPAYLAPESDEDADVLSGAGDMQPVRTTSAVTAYNGSRTVASVSQAEIESNPPYQPFHTDRRVGLYVYSSADVSLSLASASALVTGIERPAPSVHTSVAYDDPWAFGCPISTTKLDVGPPYDAEALQTSVVEDRALPASAIERVTTIAGADDNAEQIVITTRRRKGARGGVAGSDDDNDGFFEDDCEVLDFASQRV